MKPSNQGAASVEFALTSLIFLMLFFILIDFSYLFFVNLTLQHAVREGARYAVTGQFDPISGGSAQDRCDAAVAQIKAQSMGYFEHAAAVVVFKTVNADGSLSTVPANSCAGANQILVITVQGNLPLISPFMRAYFPNGRYAFTVSSTMKTEAF
jgi:Flp pilus assembly protein TadG